MTMTLIYRLIVVVAIILITMELFTQKNFALKINAGLVLIPLAMRALMIV
jgi:hypothetical protein